MKTIVKLISAAILLIAINVSSQTTPEPPTPPKTTSETKTSSSSHSYTNGKKRRSRSSSFSVKSTNSTYKLRSTFHDDITTDVQHFLKGELENFEVTDTNNSTYWKIIKNDEEVFKCKVYEGGIRIFVDKTQTSKRFQKEIKEISKKLKYIINGDDVEVAVKREKEIAKREYEIAKRKYENAKKRYNNAAK